MNTVGAKWVASKGVWGKFLALHPLIIQFWIMVLYFCFKELSFKRESKWINAPRLWIVRPGTESTSALSQSSGCACYRGDMRPFCNFFTIPSKSSIFCEDLACPMETKPNISESRRSERPEEGSNNFGLGLRGAQVSSHSGAPAPCPEVDGYWRRDESGHFTVYFF